MAKCVKCRKDIQDDFVYCPWCGKKQAVTPRKSSKRPNGMGTARPRGKTWTAISPPKPFLVDGKIVMRPITKGGFRTKTEALLAAPHLTERARKVRTDITFVQLYDEWLERHKGRVSKGTLGCYTSAYKHYSAIYTATFTDLVTADWQGCVDDCTAGKRTRQNMKTLGTLLYGYAQEQDITHKDFATHIYIGNLDQTSRSAFERSEVDLLLKAALSGNTIAAYIVCGCYTGFRPTALLNLRKSDYNAKERTLKGGIKTAAGRDRIVPVSPKIQPLIDKLLKSDGEWIFPNPKGGQLNADDFRTDYFYPCLSDLGIQPIPDKDKGITAKYTPYSWRHTFFTMLARVPGETKIKAELGGHTSYEMSQHYQHPDLADKRAIINSLD